MSNTTAITTTTTTDSKSEARKAAARKAAATRKANRAKSAKPAKPAKAKPAKPAKRTSTKPAAKGPVMAVQLVSADSKGKSVTTSASIDVSAENKAIGYVQLQPAEVAHNDAKSLAAKYADRTTAEGDRKPRGNNQKLVAGMARTGATPKAMVEKLLTANPKMVDKYAAWVVGHGINTGIIKVASK